jgi:cysteine desulfurase / selenocysteine lyase
MGPRSDQQLAVNPSDFPMLQTQLEGHPLVYLDSAATSLKPRVVIEALASHLSECDAPVHRSAYATSREATERYHGARQKVQQLIHARSPSEIIFTRGTTDSINLLADSLRTLLRPGDQVWVSAMEHHSNLVPWQMACAASGAQLCRIPMDANGVLQIDSFPPQTRLVAVAHIGNVTGTVNPIPQLAHLAHAVGAWLLVDGAQAVGHRPVDVQALDCDFYAFSGHKMHGPNGIGVLYGRESLLDLLPPTRGGGDMIRDVSFFHSTYNDLPLKFEPGTPMVAEAIALGAAVDYLQSLTLSAIQAHEQQLLQRALQIPHLQLLGNPPERGGLLSANIPHIHPLDLATLLSCRGIAIRSGHLCAQPTLQHFSTPHCFRISFGPYTTQQELDYFQESLLWAMGKLQ